MSHNFIKGKSSEYGQCRKEEVVQKYILCTFFKVQNFLRKILLLTDFVFANASQKFCLLSLSYFGLLLLSHYQPTQHCFLTQHNLNQNKVRMRKQDTATQLQEQFLNNSHITIFLQARNCFSVYRKVVFIWNSIAHCIKYITLYTTRLRMLEYFFSISSFQKQFKCQF